MANPLLEQVLSGKAPPPMKRAAANGALPLAIEDLVELWVYLRNDDDGLIRLACKENLAGVSEEEWTSMLANHPFSPSVLDFAVRVLGKKPSLLHAALKSRHIPLDTLAWLAPQAEGKAIDLLIEDQQKLIANQKLVIGLLSNPKLNMTQVRRLFDFAEQFCRDNEDVVTLLHEKYNLKIGFAGGGFEAVKEQPLPEEEILVEKPAPEVSLEQEALQADEHKPQLEPETKEDVEAQPKKEPEEEKFKTLYQKILTMSVPAKIELALKGNKEARSLLIRDSNKIVQEAVLDSPKLTESEIEAISNMRGLSNEMFSKIVRNRDWLKNYNVIKNLVMNPKVPPSISLRFISRLRDLDLKLLMKDKNVREVIRREGKKTYEVRFSRRG